MEDIFHKTCAYISLCSDAGITFNPDKFIFGQKEVEFLGFHLSEDGVRPSDKFLQAVSDFPEPRDITGARSWFGLIQQVNYAYSDSAPMAPLRHLLKPGSRYPELGKAFQESKTKMVEAVKQGVQTFDPKRPTCLGSDWSRTALGFALMQKACNCKELTPLCCREGWVLTYAGSRFTSSAESRYHPIEGEALGVAWGLHKTRHFTLGCKDLIVAVDHKPLLKIFGDRELSEIENPRILNFKEKTLKWRFQVKHIPGILHKIADAASRSPVGKAKSEQTTSTCSEDDGKSSCKEQRAEELDSTRVELRVQGTGHALLAALGTFPATEGEDSPKAILWNTLCSESGADPVLKDQHKLVTGGTPGRKEDWPMILQGYFNVPEELSTVGEVVMSSGRAVAPASLQPQVLSLLHKGHCGTTGMGDRARQLVFWPDMSQSILQCRAQCTTCTKIAPSQPAAPPTPLPEPQYPFQYVVSDFFEHCGCNYFLFCDRYSNWLSVFRSKKSNSAAVITQLRSYISTFGVMDELGTDGASVYTRSEFQFFLKSFGIRHRMSSAYNPHSNQRAEGAVKAAKRLIRENTGPDGSLDNNSFLAALIMHRKTPASDTKMSPAQVLFGRHLKDVLPIHPDKLKLNPEWHKMLQQREVALARRHVRRGGELEEHTRKLQPLNLGKTVAVQNCHCKNPGRWDCTGSVVECEDFNKYTVKMDGSGRLSCRNRQFLRPIVPYRKVLTDPEPIIETEATTRHSARVAARQRRALEEAGERSNEPGAWKPGA